MPKPRRLLLILLLLLTILPANLLVHEIGHCLTLNAAGGVCEGVYVYPGVQLLPLSRFGEKFVGDWNGALGYTVYAQVPPDEFARGLVLLMGSGSTALLAALALLLVWTLHPKGTLRAALLVQAISFADVLFYTLLPEWFGLRHFFFIGGTTPEPLEGAMKMGIPKNLFIAAVILYAALMLGGWIAAIQRKDERI